MQINSHPFIYLRNFIRIYCGEPNTSSHYFRGRHSREGGNPVDEHWIPGQARNDK
jgi:hypothetical protein